MRAAVILCAFLIGTASFVAADSRKLLDDDSNSLDALLKANNFQKIGKEAPGACVVHSENFHTQVPLGPHA